MLVTRLATVTALVRADSGTIEALAVADTQTDPRRIVAYPALTGPLAVGDRVRLNTTATALGLGTGGVDFVVAVEGGGDATWGEPDGTEHIVKLRYTPLQHAVRIAAPPTDAARTLDGAQVVVCGLHSQVAAVAAGFRAARPESRIALVHTDAAALPIAFSHLVPALKDAGLLDTTLTAGQAFGGDYECVGVPAALVSARHTARAELIVVAQGPGNAGTGTALGFSGLEQCWWLDLAGALGGEAIAVLRLSTADPRPRHRGLSHHSATALSLTARRARVAMPRGFPELAAQVAASPLAKRHTVIEADGAPGLALLAARGVRVTSMGRTVDQDPAFFHAASAAGALAAVE
jgi:hypothetical protein